MKAGTRMALGVAAGYLLGRTKKGRLALMLAAAGATGKAGVSPAKLVQSGLKQLGSSEELGQLTSVARDELVSAAKSAAVTAASGKIESLSERLREGGRGAKPSSGDEAEPEETDGGETGAEPDETETAEEEPVDEEQEHDQDEDRDEPEPGKSRRRPASRRANEDEGGERLSRRRSSSRRAAPAEDDEESSGSTRTAARRSPVRRARR